MPSIVTLTLNPAVDTSCSVDRVVAEHKLRCSPPEFDPGGGGINVVRAIREFGGRATALWTSGGPTGQLLHELLDAAGLEHRPIPIQGMTRDNLTVFEEVSTQQYRFGMPGPEFTEEDARRCFDAIRELDPFPDYLVLSGSLPPGCRPGFYAELAGQAPSSCRVVVDTSGRALKETIEAGVYLIKPNLRELGELFGRELESDADIRAAARQLVESGRVQVVVTSIGSAGALVTTADHTEHIRSPTVPIRSKVGAGDSTVAGIVYRLAAADSVANAVRYGVAAGAAAVMTAGTKLCRREDVERLYQEMTNPSVPTI